MIKSVQKPKAWNKDNLPFYGRLCVRLWLPHNLIHNSLPNGHSVLSAMVRSKMKFQGDLWNVEHLQKVVTCTRLPFFFPLWNFRGHAMVDKRVHCEFWHYYSGALSRLQPMEDVEEGCLAIINSIGINKTSSLWRFFTLHCQLGPFT